MSLSKIVCLFIFVVVLTAVAEMQVDLKSCEKRGGCQTCHSDEMQNDYCKATGRKITYQCQNGNTAFESCDKTGQDEQLQVIIFQVVMGLIGGLAYWGVQVRKKNTMSLFDYRKLR